MSLFIARKGVNTRSKLNIKGRATRRFEVITYPSIEDTLINSQLTFATHQTFKIIHIYM